MSKVLDNEELGALVLRIQNGEEAVQGELIDRTQERLFKFCFLLSHNREMAEDLCQEAFIKALQNIHKLQNPLTWVGWVYQIAKNLFIDHKRSAASKKNQREASEGEEVALAAASKDSEMEVVLTVQKVLAEFEPEERFLLLLIELEGCSYKEAAEYAGMSEDAVRSRLHRLRQAFIQKMHALDSK